VGRFDHIEPVTQPTAAADGGSYGFQHFMDQATLSMRRGRYEVALRYYGRALEQDRARAEAWAGQARALLEMGQAGEAFTWLEQAVVVAGERPAFHALRAIAAARQGKADDALAWADKAMRTGGDQAEVWLARAEVLYTQGQGVAAGRCLDKAYEREPGGHTARRCGEVSLGAGDLPRARTWLERARSQDGECPLVALRLGVYWERAGHEDRARDELSRALNLEPGLTPAQLALDDLAQRGFWTRAAARIRRWSGAS
jgi:tetratricopeptide (TPR) repeat protein